MVFSNSLRSVFRTLSNIKDGAFSENGCLTGRSHPEVFCEKSLLKNFVKFTGKDLCQSLFLNKVAGLRHTTFRGGSRAAATSKIECFVTMVNNFR